MQPCPKAELLGQPGEPVRDRVGMHRLSAGRVEGEHVGVLGEPHATRLRPLSTATAVLIKQPNTVRRERQPARGMGLGVLLPQPASGLEQVTQDQELGRLQVDIPPPQGAQLPSPSARRRSQPQQDREVGISLVRRLKEPGDLLWGGGRISADPSRGGLARAAGLAEIQPQRAA
jgi:hypothetical protein